MLKTLYSAGEIAQAMGVSRRAIAKRAALGRTGRDGQVIEDPWPVHCTQKIHGGTVHQFRTSDLPRDVVAAMTRCAAASLPATCFTPVRTDANQVAQATTTPPIGVAPDSTTKTRETRDARQAVRTAVRRLQEAAGCSLKKAVAAFLVQAQAGRLEASVAASVLCTARDGRGRKGAVQAAGFPSERSLFRWLAAEDLTPKTPQRKLEPKAWMWAACELFARPQKPTVRWVHEQLTANWASSWGAVISYDRLARFFRDEYSKVDVLKGRHHGSSLRAQRKYQHRTADGLEPFMEVHADGWATHFTAPHPVTGEFMTYEVWHFHCVATRYTTAPAIGLSESSDVILKGLENCIRFGGVPAVWQTDSTRAVKNRDVEFDEISSLSARVGVSIVHPAEIGNSQANGICERYNVYLDNESRELATYLGKGMDALVFRRVRKLTSKMVSAAQNGDLPERDRLRRQAEKQGRGIVFGSYEEAVAWINAKVHKSNNTPHSSLPKIKDPASGRLVHMTPQQSLDAAREAGWQPVTLDEASLVDLFRPHSKKKVTRETVTVSGQRYHHPDLGHFNGETIQVAVDVMDGSRVWVKDLQGRLICEATFMEASGYRCRSFYELALEKRGNAQIRRRERQIEQIEARMAPPALEAEPTGRVLPFSIANHPALTPEGSPSETAPEVPAGPAEPVKRADFSDLAMQLFGDDDQEKAAKAIRDARLQELDGSDDLSQDIPAAGIGKRAAAD